MADLGPRKEQILRAVVVEYVSAAEPVPSDLIVKKYGLGVRSATVRNELADMAEMGYLEQPHTSAGRIPSDQGYRYFVDRLVVESPLGSEEAHRVREAALTRDTLMELLTETTKVLSRLTRLISIAATLSGSRTTVRSVVLTALGPERSLLLLMLNNGHVEHRLVEMPSGLTLDHVGKANELLAGEVEGKSLRRLGRLRMPETGHPALNLLMGRVVQVLGSLVKELVKGHLVTDGEEYVLAQPEFQRDVQSMRNLLRGLEDEEMLIGVMTQPLDAQHSITIGKENANPTLQALALLRHSFYVGDEEAGTLAILGPTRMDYERCTVMLRFAARAVSDTLTKLSR